MFWGDFARKLNPPHDQEEKGGCGFGIRVSYPEVGYPEVSYPEVVMYPGFFGVVDTWKARASWKEALAFLVHLGWEVRLGTCLE